MITLIAILGAFAIGLIVGFCIMFYACRDEAENGLITFGQAHYITTRVR